MVFLITGYGWEILAISTVLSIVIFFVNKLFVNQNRMDEIQEKMKQYQDDMKKIPKDDPESMKKMEKINSEMMPLLGEQMKMTTKPLMYTMIPLLIVFAIIKGKYENVGVVVNLFGWEMKWFWWYLLSALPISIWINSAYTKYRKNRREKMKNKEIK